MEIHLSDLKSIDSSFRCKGNRSIEAVPCRECIVGIVFNLFQNTRTRTQNHKHTFTSSITSCDIATIHHKFYL